MAERMIEAVCVGCLAPTLMTESAARAAIAGRPRTTFYCDDDLAYAGVGVPRPDGDCACGNSALIVRTLPSLEHWARPG